MLCDDESFNVSQEWLGMKQVLKLINSLINLYFNNKKFVEDIRLYTLPMQKCYWINQIILIIKYKYFGAIMTITGIFYIGQPLNLLLCDWELLPGCQNCIGYRCYDVTKLLGIWNKNECSTMLVGLINLINSRGP